MKFLIVLKKSMRELISDNLMNKIILVLQCQDKKKSNWLAGRIISTKDSLTISTLALKRDSLGPKGHARLILNLY